MTERLSSSTKGTQGEAKAAAYLESDGWTVLERNFRTRVGEIDLIVQRGSDLAFVEVKAWESIPLEDLARSVGPRKRSRIVRAARLFLARRPELSSARPRFDVVFLGGAEGIRHIVDAFTEEGID